MKEGKFSKNQLRRYPIYLKFLSNLKEQGVEYVSSPLIGEELGYSQEQVRKDLQAISDEEGRPKKGRSVSQLIDSLESFLGYRENNPAILIGAGHLGSALLRYPAFSSMGLMIKAAFDVDPNKIGEMIGETHVYPLDDMERLVPGLCAKIAIICTPASVAQEVANLAVKAGCRAIWSFAPIHLSLPDSVILEEVNLASSLAVLSHRLDSLLD